MNIIKTLKKLFCVHRYDNIKLFYKINYCSEVIDNTKFHELILYSLRKCSKCGKVSIHEENYFHVSYLDHLLKLKELVEHRGAVPYSKIEGEINNG